MLVKLMREQGPSSSRVYCVFAKSDNTVLELPNCLSHEWLTFLKLCYWLVKQEYNRHVTMKVLISA